MATTLTLEEKRTLYRDGYIILRNAVSEDLVEAALWRIRAAKKGENLGGEKGRRPRAQPRCNPPQHGAAL